MIQVLDDSCPRRPLARDAAVARAPRRRVLLRSAVASLGAWLAGPAWAQGLPITAQQREIAQRVAEAGVPLAELAPDAPERYTVQRGDTLWAISRLYLRNPWRWPELWGMNVQDVRNPHRIYPGQVLVLQRGPGGARLALTGDGEPPTVKLSPRARAEPLADSAIPTLPLAAIEPFLVEAQIVDEQDLLAAPRIVAGPEGRVLMSRGDRIYARAQHGVNDDGVLALEPGQPRQLRIFRNATPVRDPQTRALLGFEARYVGQARLVRPEVVRELGSQGGQRLLEVEPATLDIVSAKEEVRVGDRLLPPAPLGHVAFVPRSPEQPVAGQVVSVYGNAVRFAGQNQVVLLDRGQADGLEPGHVLQLLREGRALRDKTDAQQTVVRLPSERNGVMVVFRVFERLAYALVLDITDGVKIGDRFANP